MPLTVSPIIKNSWGFLLPHVLTKKLIFANSCPDLVVHVNAICLLTRRKCHEMDIKAQKANNLRYGR